jgi:hypothetical protein
MQENVYCIYRKKIEDIGELVLKGGFIICVIAFILAGIVAPFAIMLGYVLIEDPITAAGVGFGGLMVSCFFVIILTITGDIIADEYKRAVRYKKKIDDRAEKICGYLSVPLFFVIVVPSVIYILQRLEDISEKAIVIALTIVGIFILLHGTFSFLCEKENYRRSQTSP